MTPAIHSHKCGSYALGDASGVSASSLPCSPEQAIAAWNRNAGVREEAPSPGVPLTDTQVFDLLPDPQSGWTLTTYGLWVARAVERAHGIHAVGVAAPSEGKPE